MPAWVVHAPYSHTDGRDYRPGDTLNADDRPNCDCTPVGIEEIAGGNGQIQAGDAESAPPPAITDDELEDQTTRPAEPSAAPRRGRKTKP